MVKELKGVKGWLLVFFFTLVIHFFEYLYNSLAYTVDWLVLGLSLFPLVAMTAIWLKKKWSLIFIGIYLIYFSALSLIASHYSGLIYVIIWFSYFYNSKRVHNTYSNNSKSILQIAILIFLVLLGLVFFFLFTYDIMAGLKIQASESYQLNPFVYEDCSSSCNSRYETYEINITPLENVTFVEKNGFLCVCQNTQTGASIGWKYDSDGNYILP